MTITLKVLAAVAVMISSAASYANAGQGLVRAPGGYAHVSWKHRHTATGFYTRQPPDLGAAVAGALVGAALQLIWSQILYARVDQT
jgi:opacity protein-like surface antigen